MAGTAGIAYPLIMNYVITGAISGSVDEYTMTRAGTVCDVWGCANAAPAGACTLTVGKGAAAITNAMDYNVADTAVVRATSIDTTNWTFAVGNALRFTSAGANEAALRGNVSVLLIPAVAYSTAIP